MAAQGRVRLLAVPIAQRRYTEDVQRAARSFGPALLYIASILNPTMRTLSPCPPDPHAFKSGTEKTGGRRVGMELWRRNRVRGAHPVIGEELTITSLNPAHIWLAPPKADCRCMEGWDRRAIPADELRQRTRPSMGSLLLRTFRIHAGRRGCRRGVETGRQEGLLLTIGR